MKLKKIKVKNFRLLRDFQMDMEDDLSLVIGKNNCGKTSLIAVMQKFIGDRSIVKDFSCDDFNIDFQKFLKAVVESAVDPEKVFMGISLKLFIEYSEKDDLSNISDLLLDLDPANKIVVLTYELVLSEDNLKQFRADYLAYQVERIVKLDEKLVLDPEGDAAANELIKKLKAQKKSALFFEFFKANLHQYFKPKRKILWYDLATGTEVEDNFMDITDEKIKLDKLINLRVISARRDVSNKETDKTLSVLSSKYYEKRENLKVGEEAIKRFRDTLTDTDDQLDGVYELLFEKVIEKVDKFGGIRHGDSVIKIISTLQQRNLLSGNTTVMYDHNSEHALPENYNGLGYMNLIGMIFEIEVLLTDFRKEQFPDEKPADINLLFIEEPEAHTHPQMQYVFIKNIRNILIDASLGMDGGGTPFNLQTIITTHSSHIAAESRFNDIKYFTKNGLNHVIAKNLQDLEKEYEKDGESENFKFLKQYLTLNRAELFFADKAIFIEGDTERILLPAMMKKIDQEHPDNPLLSQNISIVEVGAYSHIFEKFIHFIGVKSLIISDLDAGKKIMDDGKEKTVKCALNDPDVSVTTNASLKYFHRGQTSITYYLKLTTEYKILRKKLKAGIPRWVSNRAGSLLMVYQVSETNQGGSVYHPRSFEDAFFHHNRQFIVDNKDNFKSLKNIKYLGDATKSSYELAESCVGSKPSFAIEVLLNSKEDGHKKEFANWETPEYIKEGLLWIKKK
ncbi:ATP-dependent endonuclease [Mucilaginibacter mali]|uniref:ATP-dependent endonuclease n=2 Tax=Mucilaginibacter mali TaxID=2740462 RepID=A0A7D4TT29_9SPHI|nr:ATP-dependent endonuclease [Mucilaginibacter mali]